MRVLLNRALPLLFAVVVVACSSEPKSRSAESSPPAAPQQVPIGQLPSIDANGLLTVTAKEQRSGKEAKVTVQPSHGLTQDEVEKLRVEVAQAGSMGQTAILYRCLEKESSSRRLRADDSSATS